MPETAPPDKKRAFDTYDLVVDTADAITPRNKHLRFTLQNGKKMIFKAGQFVQMFIPKDGAVRRTSYSIASPPADGSYFELCVTLVDGGVSSTYLHSLKVGDKLQAMGPLGKFTMPEAPARDMAFVSTGSGIAPFRSMINDLFHKNNQRQIYLVYGNRFEEDIIYRREWEDLAKQFPQFHVMHTLSRAAEAWKGPRGYVGEWVGQFVPSPVDKDFFICGLNKMITDVSAKLKSLGVPDTQIHFERYD
jgi:ferredoxin-NADP reductase